MRENGRTNTAPRHLSIVACAAACAAVVGGCVSRALVEPALVNGPGASDGAKKPGNAKSPPRMTLVELDQLTKAYADRYSTLISSAVDAIERDNESLTERRIAHQFKLTGVSSIYDIATNPDPFTQLVDMMLVVTLQSQVWIDDAKADDAFGDRADLLIQPLRRAREDVWDIGARVMKPEQLELLDRLISNWRRKNSDVEFVSFVRFDDFAASRSKSVIAGVKAGGGFLAPVDEAKRAVDEARLFAERVFYMTKRAPFLLRWQAETLANELVAQPELSALMMGFDKTVKAADRVAGVIEKLPDDIAKERQVILDEIDRKSETLKTVLGSYDESLGKTNTAINDFRRVIEQSERLVHQIDEVGTTAGKTLADVTTLLDHPLLARDPNARPFDMTPYAETAKDLHLAVAELHKSLDAAAMLVSTDAWTARVDEVDAAAAKRVAQFSASGQELIDHAFRRGVQLACVLFALSLVYLGVKRRLFGIQRPPAPAGG